MEMEHQANDNKAQNDDDRSRQPGLQVRARVRARVQRKVRRRLTRR